MQLWDTGLGWSEYATGDSPRDIHIQNFAGIVYPFVLVVIVWNSRQSILCDSNRRYFGPCGFCRGELHEIYAAVGRHLCLVIMPAQGHDHVSAGQGVYERIAIGHRIEAQMRRHHDRRPFRYGRPLLRHEIGRIMPVQILLD